MKKITLLLCLFPCLLFAQWEPVKSPGAGYTRGVAYQNGVYLAAMESGVYRSVDEGYSWSKCLQAEGNNILSNDDNAVYISSTVGGDPYLTITIYKSIDKGVSWEVLSSYQTVDELVTDLAVSETKLFFRSSIRIYRLEKDGANQTPLAVYSFGTPTAGQLAVDGNNILVMTNYGLLKSDDDGINWIPLQSNFNDEYKDFDVHGDTIVLVNEYKTSRSFDGGQNWHFLDLPYDSIGPFWSNIEVCYTGERWLFHRNGALLTASDDAGSNLDTITAEVFSSLGHCLEIGDVLMLYDYEIYHSQDDGASWNIHAGGLEYLGPIPPVGTLNSVNDCLFFNNHFSCNNAETWTAPVNPYIKKVVAHNGLFWGFSNYNKLYVSSGDFSQWTYISDFNFFNIENYEFVGDQLLVYSLFYDIVTSADFGLTWEQKIGLPQNGAYVDLEIYRDTLIALQGNGTILFSSDLGDNWEPSSIGVVPGQMQTVGNFFSTPDLLFYRSPISFYEPLLYVYNNIADTFVLINQNLLNPITGNKLSFWDVFVHDSIVILATDSALYMTTDMGNQWVNINGNLPPANFSDSKLSVNNGYLYCSYANTQLPYANLWRRSLQEINVSAFSGQVYRDDNNNGQKDIGEQPMEGILMKAGSNSWSVSQPDGYYSMNADLDTGLLKPIPVSPYVQINPPFYQVQQSEFNKDFGIYLPPGITDASVANTATTVFRPGFGNGIFVTYTNKGTETVSGQIKVLLDQSLDYLGATPAATGNLGDTLTWDFQDLPPLQSAQVFLQVLTPASTPLNSILSIKSWVIPTLADQNSQDNYNELDAVVVGSFDPNDKQVNPTYLMPAYIANGDSIVYTIRFQNTGNYPASFVTIVDTLSQNLDIGSLEIIASSHPLTWTIRENGIVQFRFEDINLPDSTSNEPGSHGFVQYAINADSNLVLGDEVANTAHIYFDYNSPITTNTVRNTVSKNIFEEIVATISLCSGDEWNGVPWFEDATLGDTLHFPDFDSVYTTIVDILPFPQINIEKEICTGDSIWFIDQFIHLAGVYTDTILNANGCDTVSTLHLVVLPVYASTDSISVDYGGFYNGVQIFADTIITEQWTATNGCDSILTVVVDMLTDTKGRLPGLSALSATPNPSSGVFALDFELQSANNCSIKIVDNLGQTVQVLQNEKLLPPGRHRYPIEADNWAAGMYWLVFQADTGVLSLKLVKK